MSSHGVNDGTAHRVSLGSRNIAIVGPYSSGKTTLLESLLSVTGAIARKGATTRGNSVGDSAPEARARNMSVEINAAYTEYGGICFNFLDCPGSVELLQETTNALIGQQFQIPRYRHGSCRSQSNTHRRD